MEVLNKDELIQVNGGAINLGVVVAMVAISALVVGFVDAWFRPLKCNK